MVAKHVRAKSKTNENASTDDVTKSGSSLPLGKNSLLSKIGDQRCDRNCICKM